MIWMMRIKRHMVSYVLEPEDYDNEAAIRYRQAQVSLMREGKPTPLRPDAICRNLKLGYTPKQGRDPAFLGGLGAWGPHGTFSVRDDFREAVESVEPNRHEFWPLTVTSRSGKALQSRYFLFNIMAHIDALIMEDSQAEWHRKVYSPEIFGDKAMMFLKTSDEPRTLTFSRERIDDHHIWTGATVLTTEVFISEKFYDALKARNLARFFDFIPQNTSDKPWSLDENLGEYLTNLSELHEIALRHRQNTKHST